MKENGRVPSEIKHARANYNKKLLKCPECGKQYIIDSYEFGEAVYCVHCKSVLLEEQL
jgi:ribosomal protein S27E